MADMGGKDLAYRAEYMKAVLRAKHPRDIDSWNMGVLFGAFNAVGSPEVSYEVWCARMGFDMEEKPKPEREVTEEEIIATNEAALVALRSIPAFKIGEPDGGPAQNRSN